MDDNIIVKFHITDLTTGEFIKEHKFNLNEEYFINKMPNNGSFQWKGDRKAYLPDLKVNLVHLVTDPKNNKKEQRSIENLKSFCNHTGVKYDMRINKIWKDLPPSNNCHRPQDIGLKPESIGNGFGKLTPGHYGCYLAHKNGICQESNQAYDITLIFEGDVIIDADFDELYTSLFRFNKIACDNGLDLVGFGNPPECTPILGPQIEDVHCDTKYFVPAQSYLIPNKSLNIWKEKLETLNWEAWDLWIMNIGQMKVAIADKVYTKHLPGFSLVDQVEKNKFNDNPLIFVD